MASQIPEDFAEALQAAGLAAFFADCTGPHQNEYLKWIAESKRPETRQRRMAKAVQMLAAKRAGEASRARKKP
jgi:uncharacterized protein YdeI (YjbR/CyaY-like superfamily)